MCVTFVFFYGIFVGVFGSEVQRNARLNFGGFCLRGAQKRFLAGQLRALWTHQLRQSPPRPARRGFRARSAPERV